MVEMILVNVVWGVLLYCAHQEIKELRQNLKVWKRRYYAEKQINPYDLSDLQW